MFDLLELLGRADSYTGVLPGGSARMFIVRSDYISCHISASFNVRTACCIR